jgi:dipeptidyl aminopeptidase/acylaminoacyl peptidase
MIVDKQELTAELVVDGHLPSNPVLSPDGRQVVFVVTPAGQAGEHPTSALWIAAADGSSPPWALTAGSAKDSAPKWAADSESVFFLSDRVKPGTAQLHRIRLAGGEAESCATWQGGIRRFLPLADPTVVAFLASDEPTASDERRKRLRDDVKVAGERVRPARLRLLDLGTREVRTPAGFGDRHVVEVVQRPDGGPLAAVTWATPELDPSGYEPALQLLDLESGATRDLGQARMPASALTWWHAETGWHLAYVALTPPGLIGGEAVFDVAVPVSGAGEHRNLTTGMTVCPLELAVGSGELLALFADGLDTAIHRLDPGELTFAEVSRVEGWALSLTASGDVVAAIVSTAYEPKDVFAGPPHGPLTRLSDTQPKLRSVEWGTQERLAYRASDGLPLDGLLILPPGKSRQDGPFPLVTLIHGGPDARYTDSLALKWAPSGQWLAAAGYAVFQPNPRGGQGHGYEFASVIAGAVGLDEWTDTLTGIDLLIADGVADPDRLGIGGWSHGGFVSAWAVGQTDRFKASLVGAGICDWGLLAATSEQRPLEEALSGSTGWEGPGPHPHDKLSPISYASKIRTPVLIMHGEEDTNVPVSQAKFFHRALRHYGVEHEYVIYPREDHPILERNHQLDVLRRTREWFDRWMGPVA